MFCGDVMIEKLGVIDFWLIYFDEYYIWFVGFWFLWYDLEIGLYCISGVEDGGDLGLIFWVIRKFVIGFVNNNDDFLVILSIGKSV